MTGNSLPSHLHDSVWKGEIERLSVLIYCFYMSSQLKLNLIEQSMCHTKSKRPRNHTCQSLCYNIGLPGVYASYPKSLLTRSHPDFVFLQDTVLLLQQQHLFLSPYNLDAYIYMRQELELQMQYTQHASTDAISKPSVVYK